MPGHARRRRRRRAPLVVAVVVLLVAAGVAAAAVSGFSLPGGVTADDAGAPSSGGSTGSPSPTPEPPDAAPSAGACYALAATALQSAHDDSTPVACSTTHTAQTYAVPRLSDDDLGDPEQVDAALLARRAADRCRAALPAHLGTDARTLAMLRLRSAWFVPTEQDLARGARWLRCDVVALRDATSLAQLPASTSRMLATPAQRERWTTCAQGSLAQLQAGQGQRMCALEHDWRAVGTRRVGADDATWPGDDAVSGRVLERCEDQVRDYADDATASVTVGWLPPTRAQWEQEGLRFGLCWARTP